MCVGVREGGREGVDDMEKIEIMKGGGLRALGSDLELWMLLEGLCGRQASRNRILLECELEAKIPKLLLPVKHTCKISHGPHG